MKIDNIRWSLWNKYSITGQEYIKPLNGYKQPSYFKHYGYPVFNIKA